jgi:hypothetical protein
MPIKRPQGNVIILAILRSPAHWLLSDFRTPWPVTVRLAGRLRGGTAQVVDRGDPAWEKARQAYVARWKRLANRLTGPIVVISIDSGPATPR